MPVLPLSKLVAAVEQELQQSPDVRKWKVRIRETISDVYAELWSRRPWPWRIREAPLWVYPDFELSKTELFLADPSAERVFGANLNGLRTALTGRMFPSTEVDALYVEHRENLVGAELGIETTTATDRTGGNWSEGPFVIEKVGPGQVYQEQLWLDPRAVVTALDAAGGAFNVRFPRYLLPYDCDQLLRNGVMDERGVPLAYLTPEQYRYRQQGTTRPPSAGAGFTTGWTFDHGLDTTSPLGSIAASPNLWTTDTKAPAWVDQHRNVPIRETLVATAVAGASTLVTGQRYRFAVAWHYQGRFGPLSNIAEATPTASLPRITLSQMPELPTNVILAPQVAYGWELAVFMAQGDAALYLLQYINPPPNPSGGVSTSLTITAPQATSQSHWKRLRWDMLYPGTYQYIRLYPRPTAHQKFTIRYLRRPPPLTSDEDTPEFAEQFHYFLVYEAAARLAAAREGGSRTSLYLRLSAMAAAKWAEMVGFYFPGQHIEMQKGSIMDPQFRAFNLTSVDWNGDS